MTQDHLVVTCRCRCTAAPRRSEYDLPRLMPDFAKVQSVPGTVHFSATYRGDEKLLFLSDVDGERHTACVERARGRCQPVFKAIFKDMWFPPATPVADNRDEVVKWLGTVA